MGENVLKLSDDLRAALEKYASVEKELAAIGLRTDDQRKHALVHWRRLLSEQIGQLGQVLEQDRILASDAEQQREMSNLFAAMRYSLAIHQASWPAVYIDEDPAAFRKSAAEVQAKSAAFWSQCRVKFGFLRH